MVFAGLALATAMLAGLLVAPGGVLFSAVAGALVATLTSATSAALVGPSLLALLGGRLGARSPGLNDGSPRAPRWMGIVKRATARPGPAASVLVLALLLIALPALRLQTGPPDPSQLPADDPARVGFEAVSDAIGAGWTSPFFAIIAADAAPDRSQERALGAWAGKLEADPDVAAVVITGNRDRSALRATIVPRDGPNDDTTLALHDRLLGTAQRLERSQVEVAVGGQPAEFADFRTALADRAPLLVAAIVLATGLALLLVFRSLVLPLVAIVLNLLAVAAAFGVLSLLFGGSAPLGGPGFIDAVSLVGAFTVVFGLSIDYYVFLISRMREEYLRCNDHGQAILEGLRSTGIVVTGAATIMVAVFSAFALADMAAIRQLGAALSIAVALDATLVRLFLLPAVMRLLGERVWSLWPVTPIVARAEPSA